MLLLSFADFFQNKHFDFQKILSGTLKVCDSSFSVTVTISKLVVSSFLKALVKCINKRCF